MLKPNGERLKLEMARSCLTAKELAEKSGVSVGVIYRMQKSYLIRPVYLGKVAKALDIDAEVLVEKESEGEK
ncbi:MAG: helix-turn-helix domain-containing protein [Acetivibrio ethanolgignens]